MPTTFGGEPQMFNFKYFSMLTKNHTIIF
ncbi:hypothetical protein [Staphylococcus aureus]